MSGANGETSGDLNLTDPAVSGPVIAIQGAGAGLTIIDGNKLDRVLRVHPLRTATISGVTIRNGGLCNLGSATVIRTTIDHNSSARGGGIATSKPLQLTDSLVNGNTATGLGGGIYSSENVTIRTSTISGNEADNGGGIYNGKQLFVISSTISSNNARTDGGGIYNDGVANIYSSSIISNGADSDADPAGGSGAGVVNSLNPGAILNLRNAGRRQLSFEIPGIRRLQGHDRLVRPESLRLKRIAADQSSGGPVRRQG